MFKNIMSIFFNIISSTENLLSSLVNNFTWWARLINDLTFEQVGKIKSARLFEVKFIVYRLVSLSFLEI